MCVLGVAAFMWSSGQTDTLKTLNLDEVVVTGQFSPRSVKSSVYQVRVINREKIEKLSPVKLQDILMNELNIRFSQDVATGGSRISMLGMDGQNVKVLIDGVPLIGRQGTNNEISINQIDVSTIERIEIVEGPMSVIYGADALAGVINIITKKTAKFPFAAKLKLHEETIGNTYSLQQGIHNPSISFTTGKNKWTGGANFSYNYFGGWKDTAIERELVWDKKDQLFAGGFINYKDKKWGISYRIDGMDEVITNPGNFVNNDIAKGDSFATDKQYFSNRLMQQVQSNVFINGKLNLQGMVAYSDYNRRVHSEWIYKNSGGTYLDPTPESQSLVNFKGYSLRTSAVYTFNEKYSIQPGIDINREQGSGERMRPGQNKIGDYALFVSAELKPSTKINIRPGIRAIKNTVYKAPPVVPSINIKYILSPRMDVKASYAHGFRAPSLRELYMDFFDINHSIIGNPNLKAEVSNTFNLSLNYATVTSKNIMVTTSFGGFWNEVNNMIDYAVSATSADTFTLVNLYKSKNAGTTFNGKVKYGNFSGGIGAAYTGFFNIYSAQEKSLPQMQWATEVSVSAAYQFIKAGLDANIFYKYTGAKPGYMQYGADYVAITTDPYHWADFTLNKKINQALRISGGIKNLFDVKRLKNSVASISVHTNNNTLSIGTGRSYFLGLTYDFIKK